MSMDATGKTEYRCKVCGALAAVNDDQSVTRTCEHNGAPMIANLKATLYGKSRVAG